MSKMSQEQFPWMTGVITPPQETVPYGTVNPADLFLRPEPTSVSPVPVRQGTNNDWELQLQHQLTAALQSEKGGDVFLPVITSPGANSPASALANPPDGIPARQEALFTFGQPPLHPAPAAQQPENDVWAFVPDNDGNFFADTFPNGAQPNGRGPQPLLARVSAQEAEEMRAASREAAKKRKLGPRQPKNAVGAAALRQQAPAGVRKSGRPGPRKAGPGQQGYARSVRSHATHCREAEGCKPDCPLRSDWPEVYALLSEKKKRVEVGGQPTWVKRLWSHEYTDRSNRER